MKNLLTAYTAIISFVCISIIFTHIAPNDKNNLVALADETSGVNRSIYYCRMLRSDLDRDPLKVCNELIGGYMGYDKWDPGYNLKIGPNTYLQYAETNPHDTRCSVVQWDVYEQAFVRYSADANNYCHYEENNNHCLINGTRSTFNNASLNLLKTQFDQKCGTPTATPTPLPTYTPPVIPTSTPKPTATSTPRPTATSTPKPTATSTPKPTATSTPKPTATSTPRPTATATPVPTATMTPSPTATSTPNPTATMTPSPTATVVPTPTVTMTVTPTVTNSPTPTVIPTVTLTVTPTITATPVITPTPILGDDSVFGFNISKEVVGKLHYQVGELIIFNVNFKNTGTEVITRLYMRDSYSTDMRVEKVMLIQDGERIEVTGKFFKSIDDMDTGLIIPKDPFNQVMLLNLVELTGVLEENQEFTLEFVFKAVSKSELACNQAFSSPNSRREIVSPKVCVEIDAVIPVTD